ncbi:hypothetical protein ACFLUU_02880 [Chloroflexota bacterium]
MDDNKQQQDKITPRVLARKLREKGIVYCIKAALRMAYQYVGSHERHFLTPLKFMVNLFRFLFSRKTERIILGVWDYKTIPWSIGDLLYFIETLSVLKLKHGADKVDVCVVCESENPAGNRGYKNITPGNFRYQLFNLLPLISTSPYLGSMFQFDSRAEFYSFLRHSINKYEIYPPINQQLAETFNFYGGATLKEIQDFYREHAYIPYLTIDDYHLSWAYDFYETRAKGLLPVVVSLRWHPHAKPERNAERDVWLGFFDLCKSAFPEVAFVVVGTRGEVFEELRRCHNVIVAKDHGSTLLDDLALIRTSLLYMGRESGVSEIAVFSDVPYLLFGREEIAREAWGLEPDTNYEFATEHQKAFYASSFVITPDSLLREFSNLYNQLDTDKWRKKASESKSTPYTFAI